MGSDADELEFISIILVDDNQVTFSVEITIALQLSRQWMVEPFAGKGAFVGAQKRNSLLGDAQIMQIGRSQSLPIFFELLRDETLLGTGVFLLFG